VQAQFSLLAAMQRQIGASGGRRVPSEHSGGADAAELAIRWFREGVAIGTQSKAGDH